MKRFHFLKALVLSCLVAAVFMLPSSLNAQKSDVFFRVDNDDVYNDRTDGGFNISNYGVGEPVPVGSGLLILALTGAGYAVARRRRNRKDSRLVSKCGSLLLVFALVLGMTQCKKHVEQLSTNDLEPADGLKITLKVGDNSKVIVEPEGTTHPDWATVEFEDGDRIYVANNGMYCGYLDYENGAFTGTISETSRSEDDYFHFYFMGNKAPSTSPVVNSSTGFYVDITDQTEKYPIISYARSTSLYVTGKTDYEARLQNYCAIVKFETNIPTNNVVTIKGMNNKVTVNFSGVASTTYQPYTYGKMDTEGRIQLHSEGDAGTEKWAILLPQNEVTSATAVVKNYATEGSFTVPEVSAEWENAYMNSGINIDLVRVFTVGHYSEGYTKAVFAPGNLQYKASPSTWRFAEHQWDYVGGVEKVYQSGTYVYPQYGNVFEGGVQCNNNEISTSYTGWIDLFGWGTGNNPTLISDKEEDYNYTEAKDWGNNPISYGSTTYASGYWKTPSMYVYEYLINTRKLSNVTISGGATAEVYGWGSATVNGVPGMVFFPDDWDGTACTTFNYPEKNGSNWTNCAFTTNQFTETEWNNTLGDKGCIFIPYAGRRLTSSSYAPYYYNYGYLFCWSSNDRVLSFSGSTSGPSIYGLNRRVGASVRLYRVVAEYVND